MRDESFKDYVLDLFSDWEGVSSKRMFGGWGVFHDGVIFGIIIDGELYFKVDDTNITDYEKYGSRPFTYLRSKREVSLSYWLVPEEIMEDGERLSEWALMSIEIKRRQNGR